MKLVFCLGSICGLVFNLAASNTQWQDQQESIVQARFILPQQKFQRQQSYTILVEADILEGWHINSHKPLEKNLILTEVGFRETKGVSSGRIQYMEPVLMKFSFSDTDVSVFEGRVYFKTNLTISPDAADSALMIQGFIYYQACNDASCLAPETVEFSQRIPLAAADESPVAINDAIFRNVESSFKEETPETGGVEFSRLIKDSGLFYTLLFIFLGGLALNLTPCVYPLIPITISYFGGQSSGRRRALVLRAIIYVLGMSITYSVLGVIAALTGELLGSALQNPLVLIFIALILIVLALSMFGLYEIRVPQSLAILGGTNRAGYLGTLFMGLTVGLIAAPCIGPFVLGLLTYVGNLGDPFMGFLMFFILALGLGTPFLVLGISSGALNHLPRSGAWMVWVRNLFGFVLIAMALYFLQPLFTRESIYLYIMAFLFVAAGVYLGWLDKNTGGRIFKVVRNLIGVTGLVLAVLILLPERTDSGEKIAWQPYSPELLQQASQSGKLVVIDFFADWCIPCKELDNYTFTDERVLDEFNKFITIKVDLTRFTDASTDELRTTFDVKGVPTIVFLSTTGEEIKELRLTGFEEADKFLDRMQKAKILNN